MVCRAGMQHHSEDRGRKLRSKSKLKHRAIGRAMNPLKSYALRASVLISGIKAGAMAAALGLGMLWPDVSQAAETPFAHLTGSWSGQGKITGQNSSIERIRYRGT